MKTLIKLFAGMAAIFSTSPALGQEGISYPPRVSYFMLDQKYVWPGAYALDYFNSKNQLPVYGLYADHVSDRHGFTNSAMYAQKVAARKTMSETSHFNITENGFSVAFWTKYPYPVSNAEQITPVLTLENNDTVLWQCGLVEDGRVYVRRYTNKTDNSNQPWNVKFWEPTWGNIGRYVAEHGADKWFFIMLVQEKGQMRLHIGMPDGKFDCMYLDYGLDDQVVFKRNIGLPTRKISVFPDNERDLYLDDLALWTIPLCRTEAFEYFKDQLISKPADSLYAFYNSTESDFVHDDDTARMEEIHRMNGYCMTAPPQMVVAESELLAAVAPENAMNETRKQTVTIYPNPASNRITIDFGEAGVQDGNIHAQLYDMAGRLIAQKRLERIKGQRSVVWDNLQSNKIPTGIYVLKCISGPIQYSATIMLDCGCGM